MRFVIIVTSTKESDAGVLPDEKLPAEIAEYHEEPVKGGASLDGSSLQQIAEAGGADTQEKNGHLSMEPSQKIKKLVAGHTFRWPPAMRRSKWTSDLPTCRRRQAGIEGASADRDGGFRPV